MAKLKKNPAESSLAGCEVLFCGESDFVGLEFSLSDLLSDYLLCNSAGPGYNVAQCMQSHHSVNVC